MATYSIDDPRKIAREAPYTFFIPDEHRLSVLEVGDSVKLMFRPDPPDREYETERMWVNIDQINGDEIVGTLDNDPFDMPQLKSGDQISFKRYNIISIKWADNEKDRKYPVSNKEYYDRCIVDACVIEGDVPVYYIYREEPDLNEEADKYPDSGWRIRGDYRGLSDEEIDSREAKYVALGVVLNQDDSWLHLIAEPIGAAYVRNFETNEFAPDE